MTKSFSIRNLKAKAKELGITGYINSYGDSLKRRIPFDTKSASASIGHIVEDGRQFFLKREEKVLSSLPGAISTLLIDSKVPFQPWGW